jgi:hypothetical protein
MFMDPGTHHPPLLVIVLWYPIPGQKQSAAREAGVAGLPHDKRREVR